MGVEAATIKSHTQVDPARYLLTVEQFDPKTFALLRDFRNKLIERFGKIEVAFKAAEHKGRGISGLDRFELEDLADFVGCGDSTLGDDVKRPCDVIYHALESTG